MMAYFELILLILTVASGVIALIDIFFFEKDTFYIEQLL